MSINELPESLTNKINELAAERITIKNRLSNNPEELSPKERSELAARLKVVSRKLNNWFVHKIKP